MLPNAGTPQHHSGTWDSISTTHLGSRLLKLRTYALPPLRMMFANVVFIVGSRHCSYVHSELLPPITLLLRKNCVAFILVSSTTAHQPTLRGIYSIRIPKSIFRLISVISQFANCPTCFLLTCAEATMFHSDTSQLAVEFSIRQAVCNQIISNASSNLVTWLCKLLRPIGLLLSGSPRIVMSFLAAT